MMAYLQFPMWVTTEIIPGLPLGYTFGRLGNFINGELYGRVTTAPWGVVFPHARRFRASEPWVGEWATQIGMEVPGADSLVNLNRTIELMKDLGRSRGDM